MQPRIGIPNSQKLDAIVEGRECPNPPESFDQLWRCVMLEHMQSMPSLRMWGLVRVWGKSHETSRSNTKGVSF